MRTATDRFARYCGRGLSSVPRTKSRNPRNKQMRLRHEAFLKLHAAGYFSIQKSCAGAKA